MPPLLIAAQCKPASRLKDDSVTLKFVTAEEITTALFAHIDGYRGFNGWLWFAPDKPTDADMPTANAAVEGEGSPSQQLRRALYALHLKRGGERDTWPAFYQREMERFRQRIIDAME